METITMLDVKAEQPNWFSPENKRFFGDRSYEVLQGEKTGNYYLARLTKAWTDMFGQKSKHHWRLNNLDQQTAKIKSLTDDVFDTLDDVRAWLANN